MSLNHVMLDLETMGTKPGSVILSVGAVFFDFSGGIGPTFYRNIAVHSCLNAGLVSDPKTREWWRHQSVEARTAITTDPQPLADVVRDFSAWFRTHRGKFVWGQGAAFDPPLWEAACHAVNVDVPCRFWNVRDTRTAYDVCFFDPKSLPRDGTYHNALDDALHQVKCIVTAMSNARAPDLSGDIAT